MKIISVKLLNLNSLVGENTIDFTSPQFEESGIFAIVGPTGSGKTTILDAICLALYGETPRLKNISKSTNEIMSKTTGECFAEVVFETTRGGKSERFRCRWSQRRARSSPTGALQSVEHELSETETGKILEEKSKVPRAVEEKTGMSFDQFTRSMMLAQGDFTRFLKSNKDQRGDILEKITGMQIYSDISKKVFERNREEKNNLALLDSQLKGIVLMDEPEETRLREELADWETQDAEVRARLEQIRKAIEHGDKVENLRQQAAELETQWREHEQKTEEFIPLAEQLAQADRATHVETAWLLYDNVRKQRDNLVNALAEAKDRLPKANNAFDLARQQETNASEGLKNAKKRQEDEKPLIEKVVKLDEAIRLFNDEIVLIDHRISQSKNEVTNHQTGVTKAKDELAKLFPGDSLSETEKETEQILEQIEQLLDGKSTAELLDTRELLNKKLSSLKDLAGTMVAQEELANGEKQWTDRRAKAKDSFDGIELRIAECTKTHDDLATRCKEIQERLDERRRIQNFEEARNHLKDGHECPLCGALEHPFAQGNAPIPDEIERELVETKKNRDDIRAKTEQLRIEQAEQKSLEEQARKMLDENDQKKQTLHEVQQKQLAGMKLDELPSPEATKAGIDESQAAITTLTTRIDSIVALQDKTGKLNKKLEQGRKKKNKIETETALLEQARQTLETRQAEKTLQAAKRQEKADQRTEIYADKIPSDVERRLTADVATAERNLETAQRKRGEAETLFARTQEQITSAKTSLNEAETNYATAESVYRQQLKEKGFEAENDFHSALLKPAVREELATRKADLALRRKELETLRAKNTEDLKNELSSVDLESQPVYRLSREELTAERETRENVQKELGKKIIEIKVKLDGNAAARKTHEAIAVQRNRQDEICRLWAEMNRLIGSSDGTAFKVFAQGLTFRLMIEHANAKLRKMTDRYELVQSDSLRNPLELAIVDTYQADAVRSTENLSGGESFLVSLALALGLAEMSSNRIRVDSLFLDEGFGTLDDQTLDTALAALEELRAEGKQIGVISHVPAIRERIATQIQLQRVRKGRHKVHIVPEIDSM